MDGGDSDVGMLEWVVVGWMEVWLSARMMESSCSVASEVYRGKVKRSRQVEFRAGPWRGIAGRLNGWM